MEVSTHLHQMEASGQLHDPTGLIWRKSIQQSFNRRLSGSQSRSLHHCLDKGTYPWRASNHNCLPTLPLKP